MTDHGSAARPPSDALVGHEVALQDGDFTAHVRVRAPASWQLSPRGVVLRDEFQEAIAGVEFTVMCRRDCDPAQPAQVIEHTLELRGRPNISTGDAALDAVRLTVDVTARSDLPDGKLAVARVTKPAGLAGPYREQLVVVCARGTPTGPGIAAQAWAPIARAAELEPLLLAACRGFEIL